MKECVTATDFRYEVLSLIGLLILSFQTRPMRLLIHRHLADGTINLTDFETAFSLFRDPLRYGAPTAPAVCTTSSKPRSMSSRPRAYVALVRNGKSLFCPVTEGMYWVNVRITTFQQAVSVR